MNQGAIGIVETKGFVRMIEAVDTMLKSANISILKQEKIGGGLMAICIQGDVGSVRVATDAGVNAASKAGGDVRATVIANPSPGLLNLLT